MGLTVSQIKSLWIAQQELMNPRFSFMNPNDVIALEAELSNEFDGAQSVIVSQYLIDPVNTTVSDGTINDDSEREPFNPASSQVVLGTTVSNNFIPLVGGNRIYWWDEANKKLAAIWLLDGDPNDPASKVIGDIGIGDGQIMDNPADIPYILYRNQYWYSNGYWIPEADPLSGYLKWTVGADGLFTSERVFPVLSDIDFFSTDLLTGLQNETYDPQHPEAINPNWTCLNATGSTDPGLFVEQGGPIISDCHLYVLFIGDTWNTTNSTARTALVQFHDDYFSSDQMNVLTQYGVNGGTVSGDLTITGIPPIVSDSFMQSAIQSAIDKGFLPPPDVHNFYFGYLDPTITISGQRQLSYNSQGASGYHDHFSITGNTNPVRYGFASFNSNINVMTVIGGHEVAEALTDPDYTAWTPDHGVTEIADICEGQFGTIGTGQVVQQIWDMSTQACVLGAVSPITNANNSGTALHNFIWKMPEYEALDSGFKYNIDKDLSGHFSIHTTTTQISFEDWYAKWIQPLSRGSSTTRFSLNTDDSKPLLKTVDDVLRTLNTSGSYEYTVALQGEGYVLLSAYASWVPETLYFLWYNDGTQWSETGLREDTGDFLRRVPTQTEIDNGTYFRDRVVIVDSDRGKEKIYVTNESISAIEYLDLGIIYGSQSVVDQNGYNLPNNRGVDPTDPNAFYPGQYFILELSGPYVIWVSVTNPFLFYKVLGNDINIDELFFDSFYIFSRNSQMIEGNELVGNVSLNVNLINIPNINGGVYPYPNILGYTGVDLDGNSVSKNFPPATILPQGNQNGVPYTAIGYPVAGAALYNKKYWLDTYLAGRRILPWTGTYVSTMALPRVTNLDHYTDTIGDMIDKYSMFDIIEQSGDHLVLQGTDSIYQFTIQFYFVYDPDLVWTPPSPTLTFVKHKGACYLTKMYIMAINGASL